jgi:hypothetical protein
MHSILLVVPKPALDNVHNQQKWTGCLRNLEALAMKNKDIQMLSENILLIPLDYGLDAFWHERDPLLGLPYRYIIFDEEIEWHEVSKRTS